MNRSSISFIAGAIVAAAATTAILNHPTAKADAPPMPDGFTMREIRFDESMGNKLPTPQIPRSWKFIGVSNGEKPNNNNLWFQDSSGTIYMAHGFAENDAMFILSDYISVLHPSAR